MIIILVIVSVISVFVILGLLILLGSEVRTRESQIQSLQDYITELRKPIIVETQKTALVARWVCCSCGSWFVLNYYRNMYHMSKDRLDITGSFKSYDCSQCGSNLMQLKLINIPDADRTKIWGS